MNNKLKTENTDKLIEALLNIKTKEEYYSVFEDLCTVQEIQSLSQRFEVARLLDENKTYNEIQDLTGASAATISRIHKCLNYGEDGYRLLLDRTKDGSK